MRKFYIPLMLLIIFLPVGGRLLLHQFDATFFIVADRMFTNPDKLPIPMTVVNGAGYDGQFFFKTALDLSSSKYQDAIHYDGPAYRNQRILYPLLAWLLALGYPAAIPFILIAINCIALLGVWMLFQRVCIKNNLDPIYSALPLMYSGLHMATGRDLAEPMELLLVLGAFLAVPLQSPILFSSLSLMAFFTKETTIIYLLPVALFFTVKNAPRTVFKFIPYALIMGLPYIMFLAWKIYLNSYYQETAFVQGTHDFSLPLTGMLAGFAQYFSQRSLTNTVSFGVASLYFIWLIWLIVMTMPHVKKAAGQFFKNHYVELVWGIWLALSLFFSNSIFMDDWGFVRIFTVFVGSSFLILYSNQQKPGKWFILFSIFMYGIMTVRLWLRA